MTDRRAPRAIGWVAVGIVALTIGAGTGWAANAVLSPPPDVLSSEATTYATVSAGEVGSSFNLVAVGEWTSSPVGANRAAGVVTSVSVSAGDEVAQGDQLYAVDLRPVVVAQGSTPAFRAITAGTEGPDVAQLQEMLSALGFYDGDVDGKAGTRTVVGIEEWQKSRGLEPTGIVSVGDVVFVPSLPARVILEPESINRGAILVGGESAVRALAQMPTFTLPVTEAQARMLVAGTPVEIDVAEGEPWSALTGEQTTDDSTGTTTVALVGVNSQPICVNRCQAVPLDGREPFPALVITAETVAGLVVPSAALVTASDGATAVIDENGILIPAKVVLSARGMSVIEGVAGGTRVKLPAERGK